MNKDEKAPAPAPSLPPEETRPSILDDSGPTPAAAAPLDEKEVLRAKVEEYANDLRRLQAEFQNYQNRATKEKLQANLDGQALVLRHFLSFKDEMESALSHLRGASVKENARPAARAPATDASVCAPAPDSSASELRKGVELLHLKMVGLFSSVGVKEISGTGVADPHKHEVLLQVSGGKEGHIAQVLRKGYILGDHVLRVAQVSVYSGVKPEAKKTEQHEGETMNSYDKIQLLVSVINGQNSNQKERENAFTEIKKMVETEDSDVASPLAEIIENCPDLKIRQNAQELANRIN